MIASAEAAAAPAHRRRERHQELLTRPVQGGMVRLVPDRGPALAAILASAPVRSGGVGGWQSVERMGRRPAKWWQATPDDALTLELILDRAVPTGSSVENRLRTLRGMGAAGKLDEPPFIQLRGDIDPADQALRWVLQDLGLGDRLYRDGRLRRQAVTVELAGYVAVPAIEPIRVRKTRGKNGDRRRRGYTTRRGDTLRRVAVAELGSSPQWRDIVTWNPGLRVKDPDKALPVNTRLVLR